MIHQPLALGAFQKGLGAINVIEAKLGAGVPFERRLGDLALQIMLRDGVKRSVHGALDQSMK